MVVIRRSKNYRALVLRRARKPRPSPSGGPLLSISMRPRWRWLSESQTWAPMPAVAMVVPMASLRPSDDALGGQGGGDGERPPPSLSSSAASCADSEFEDSAIIVPSPSCPPTEIDPETEGEELGDGVTMD